MAKFSKAWSLSFALGWQLFVAVMVAFYAGDYVDIKLGIHPYGKLLLILLFFVSVLYFSLVRIIKEYKNKT